MSDEPLFNFKNKSDQEQFDFMMAKSETARHCYNAFLSGNQLFHSLLLIDLVKIGYTRDELRSFLRIVYSEVK